MKKTQIFIIHGGDTHASYKQYLLYLKKRKIDFKKYQNPQKGWKKTLGEKLGGKFEVILPDMPAKLNAKYPEWKIWFEKFIPHIKPNAIFIGHSLGGIFLAKYLSENKFPKKIEATFLVAAPYDSKNRNIGYTLGDFVLPKTLSKFQKQSGKIFICRSINDPIVPFIDANKYKKALPTAQTKVFKNRAHFNQTNFPEIVKMIKENAV